MRRAKLLVASSTQVHATRSNLEFGHSLSYAHNRLSTLPHTCKRNGSGSDSPSNITAGSGEPRVRERQASLHRDISTPGDQYPGSSPPHVALSTSVGTTHCQAQNRFRDRNVLAQVSGRFTFAQGTRRTHSARFARRRSLGNTLGTRSRV